MTLADLIRYLEQKNLGAVATPGFGSGCSYRGYYNQIAFEPVARSTAGQMLAEAEKCMGSTFQGYKGGTFLMGPHTLVNIAPYGSCDDDDALSEERLDGMFAIAKADSQEAELESLRAEVKKLTAIIDRQMTQGARLEERCHQLEAELAVIGRRALASSARAS